MPLTVDKREQLAASRKWLSADACWNPLAGFLKGATITAQGKTHLGKKPLRSHSMRASGEEEVDQSKPNPRWTCHFRYQPSEWIRQSQGRYTVWANSILGPEMRNTYSPHWIFSLYGLIILPPELLEKVWRWDYREKHCISKHCN